MPLSDLSKPAVFAAFEASLEASIGEASARARATAASATHEEARPEDDKDTRAIEESYLAAGQAQRAADLELERAEFKSLPQRTLPEGAPIAAGALVALEDEEGAVRVLLITTTGGGRTVTIEGTLISAVTPNAPLGSALVGSTVGDEVTVTVGKRVQDFTIVEVV